MLHVRGGEIALLEDPDWFPVLTWQLTNICNFNPRSSSGFCEHEAQKRCTDTHADRMPIHIEINGKFTKLHIPSIGQPGGWLTEHFLQLTCSSAVDSVGTPVLGPKTCCLAAT